MSRQNRSLRVMSSKSEVPNLMKNVTTITEEDESVVCLFCKSSRLDELNLGPLYRSKNIVTHYFCMLFSAALKQNGADDEGILGFLAEDIQKEARRCLRQKCVYCEKTGASVGCCNKRCKEVFHFPCGLEKGASFQFHSRYESYCAKHLTRKLNLKSGELNDPCPICMSGMTASQRLVQASCCKLSSFHKECIQKMALSAGYFFKCPMCNRTQHFLQEMRSSGIYVPEQDASWEIDNSFHELYVRYTNCDAENCRCKFGRQHVSPKGSWTLARCRLCGAAGVHKECGNLEDVEGWACQSCLAVELKTESEIKTARQNKTKTKFDLHRPSTSRQAVPAKHKKRRRRARFRRSKYVETTKEEEDVADEDNHEDDKDDDKKEIEDAIKDDDDFKLSDITIHSTCFSYFPYTKQALKNHKVKTIPDWRYMELRVNLCRWLPDSGLPFQIGTNPIPKYTNQVQRFKRRTKRAARKRKRSRSILEMELEEVESDILLKVSRMGDDVQKQWDYGVLKPSPTVLRRRLLQLHGSLDTVKSEATSSGSTITKNSTPSPSHTTSNAASTDEESISSSATQLKSQSGSTRFEESSCSLPKEFRSESKTTSVERSTTSSRTHSMLESEASSTETEYEIEDYKVMEAKEENANLHTEMVDLSQSSEDEEMEPEVAKFPAVIEPTPEQVISFRVLGDRLRTELSQNINRENILSQPKNTIPSTRSYGDTHWYLEAKKSNCHLLRNFTEL